MTVQVNGEKREVADGATLEALIVELSLQPAATVAELNGRIVERDAYATTALSDGDRLELLRFVGGG